MCSRKHLLETILTLSKTKRGVDAGEILRKTKKKTNVQERVKPERFGTLTTAAAAAFWVAIILARYLFNICYLLLVNYTHSFEEGVVVNRTLGKESRWWLQKAGKFRLSSTSLLAPNAEVTPIRSDQESVEFFLSM